MSQALTSRFSTVSTARWLCAALSAAALTGCETTGSQKTRSAAMPSATQPLEGLDTPDAQDPIAAGQPQDGQPQDESTFAGAGGLGAGGLEAGGQAGRGQEPVIPYAPNYRTAEDLVFDDPIFLAHQRAARGLPDGKRPQDDAADAADRVKAKPDDANTFTSTLPRKTGDGHAGGGPSDAAPPAASPEPAAPQTRQAVLRQAQHQLADTNDPAWDKAVAGVAISAAAGDAAPPQAALAGLTDKQTRQLKAYHEVLRRLAIELPVRSEPFDPNAIMQAAQPAAYQSVQITNLQLCRAVHGYGKYESLSTQTLVAGRPAPMVIYTELDGFKNHAIDTSTYETRVSQQIRLYHVADDLLVWEQPAQTLTDTANRQRRDFFLVQMISLPANLGPGSYILKVTVVDHHSDTMWEESKTLDVVTQDSLVTASAANAPIKDGAGWGTKH